MSYRQVAAVLDHAPASLTPAEVVVLVSIAEASRGPGDQREISTEDLARRARLTRSSLRDAIARLAGRGIKVRVPIGVDRRGRPLYAVPGTVPRWTLPDFPAPAGCRCERCRQGGDVSAPAPDPADPRLSPQGGDQSTPPTNPQASKGGVLSPPPNVGGDQSTPGGDTTTAGVDQSTAAVDTTPPYPSRAVPVLDQRQRPTLTYVTGLTGATDDEARRILKTLTKRHRPRSIGAYVRGIPAADLTELLAEIRDHDQSTAGPGLPEPCGTCGPGRLLETPDGRAKRCPRCHPGARRTA